MSSNLNPGDFANPNSVVGAYSASAAATQTTTNSEAVPNRFSNDLVYVGSNTYGGTASNVQAAKGKFVRLSGGRKIFARNNKMNGGTKLGMNLENISASVGTVGAGYPGLTKVNYSADRPNQPANKIASSDIKGGRRHRRRTKNKQLRKMKKTKRHNRKTRARKSHKKRMTRKRLKMRGGSLVDGCGCNGGSSRKKHHSKRKSSKMKGAGSCSSHSKGKKMKGGTPQPFSNKPMSFGYSLDGSSVNSSTSALASPMPFKSYFACENVSRN